MRAELGSIRAELPSVVREIGDAEAELSRVDVAVRAGSAGRGTRGDVWRDPRGLELASASLREDRTSLDVRFVRGAEIAFDLRSLRLPAPAVAAEVDDLRHGVVLRLSNGERLDLSSDRILFDHDTRYRAAHEVGARGSADVGARIRELRLAAGLTARNVAAAAGLAPSNYARLEASRHAPRIETLVRVAAALRVPIADLVRAATPPPRVTPDRRRAPRARRHSR